MKFVATITNTNIHGRSVRSYLIRIHAQSHAEAFVENMIRQLKDQYPSNKIEYTMIRWDIYMKNLEKDKIKELTENTKEFNESWNRWYDANVR